MQSIAVTLLSTETAAALKKLGSDLRDARRRRGIKRETITQHMRISTSTWRRLERGDGNVRMAIYALALQALGFAPKFGELADVRCDAIGLALDRARLPLRVRETKSVRGGLVSPPGDR